MRVYCVVDKKGYFMAARYLVITSWNRIQIYERQRFLKKRFLTKLDFPIWQILRSVEVVSWSNLWNFTFNFRNYKLINPFLDFSAFIDNAKQ